MIEISNLVKTFSGRTVVDIPSLHFELGRRYALIGTNGSGKSTLLRLISGTLQPTSGTIQVNVASAKELGYMPQKPYAFALDMLKNVMLALPPSISKQQAAALAHDALLKVGIAQLEKMRGNRLSGGETQRMAFARMIVMDRKVLLLDEPTSATDIAGNDLVETALLDYHKRTGCTVVFATHSLPQALRLADEVIVLEQGKVLEQGPAEQVLKSPENERVRVFLEHWRLD